MCYTYFLNNQNTELTFVFPAVKTVKKEMLIQDDFNRSMLQDNGK